MNEDRVIHNLVLQQMAPWLGTAISRAFCEEIYQTLNLTVRSIFLYRIKDGEITLLEKPGYRMLGELQDSRKPEPEGKIVFREEYIRATMYRDFLARVLDHSPVICDMLIAIDVNDAPIDHAPAPVLAFQKRAGSNLVLLPDVDFLHANFYIPPQFVDETPYESKLMRAVFAGSTTGGRTITANDVRVLAIPRLRAAVFFKGSRHVDFRLPRIVQCESDDVVAMVAALGVGGEPMSWQDQFQYRFILSMDGNGATCSRVAIGLLSRAALAKYESQFQLYYFAALTPWRHYIPIVQDEDVEHIVEEEQRRPMTFAPVAEEGATFARRYLGRMGNRDYMLDLIMRLQAVSSEVVVPRLDPREQAAEADPALIEIGAHVQNIGDVWGWPGEWLGKIGSGLAIEAIAVVPTGIPRDSLAYRVVLRDGTSSNFSEFGAFCGTRGRDWPLRGFEVQLRGEARDKLTCTYSGRFTDGTQVGPLAAGELCQAPSGATLEGFQINVRMRSADA